ncbi:MAG: GNAT family N-acetyltransferase [Ktedonobacterales bacterium]|nr:GNAT family N-acetyltransferase [Ktedonobacterales bacterium]
MTHDQHRQDEPLAALAVRSAQPEDRDAVFAFCARTWGDDGDYLPSVWDAWLRDTTGTLLIGTLDEWPVAVAHIRMLSDDEAWIEGVRVDPTLRQRGLGRVLISRALVVARERGAAVARLISDADNLPSQRLFAAFGFTRVAELAHYQAEPLTLETKAELSPLLIPTEADFERIWAWLEQSNLTPFNGGLEVNHWTARALTEPQLRAYLTMGAVMLLEAYETIQALAVAVVEAPEETKPMPVLFVRYMDGQAEGIGRLALALRRRAAERHLTGVRLWLPDLHILQDAMDGAGYLRKAHGLLWIYAREL